MCKTSYLNLRSGQHNCQINWCADCEKFSIHYKEVCLSYNETELKDFGRILRSLRPSQFSYYFQDEPQVLIKNKESNSGFLLNQNEVHHLAVLIEEVNTTHPTNTFAQP